MRSLSLSAFAVMLLFLSGCLTTVSTLELSESERDYIQAVNDFPTEFSLPNDEAEAAWARSIRYLNEHSQMKIETSTDYSIRTYSPNDKGAIYFGYSITRVPDVEETTFKVIGYRDSLNFGNKEVALQNAKLLAYYMATGELQPQFINTKLTE